MKNRDVARRAWNRLRLALLWARKGGVLSRRLIMELGRLVPKYLKRLGHTTSPSETHYYYGRELSFDKTPIFHVKMQRPSSMRFHLPRVPCITLNPQVDFDDDNDDEVFEYDNRRKGSLIGAGHDHEQYYYGYEEEEGEGEAEIDKRAEEFIAKFYRQMKLQRQISYLQYNETPNRD